MGLGRSAALFVAGSILLGVLSSCTATARIIDVYTALDARGDRKRQVFYTDTTELHCVIEAGISRPGATIEVQFHQLQAYDPGNGKFFDTDRFYANTEFAATAGDQKQFYSARLVNVGPDGKVDEQLPLDPGRYQCEVRLEGKLEQIAIFNILFADCPPSEIIPFSPCYGFFEAKRECPRYGAQSTDRAKCVCQGPTEGGKWDCK